MKILLDRRTCNCWQAACESHFGWHFLREEINPIDCTLEIIDDGNSETLETLAGYGDDRLEEIPPPLAERGLNMRQVLMIIGWHEAHHHGQAHAVLNVFLGQQG